MVKDALRRRIHMDVVGDQLAVDRSIERRAHDARTPLMQTAHRVEAVRDMRDAMLLYDLDRRLVVGA